MGNSFVRGEIAASTASDVRLSEVLAGLSYALDLTEGQRQGHSARSCLIGMRIGEAIGLSESERSSLFYALLMKDLGCSSNAARFAALFGANDHDLKSALTTINWSRPIESFRFVTGSVAPGAFWLTRVWRAMAVFSRGPEGACEVVRTRCERGADIAKLLGFTSDTVQAIRSLDEHWDGQGLPYALKSDGIPLLGRIVCLAQTFEVFLSTYGALTAFDMAATRRGTWFDPDLVDALRSLRSHTAFWQSLRDADPLTQVSLVEPADRVLIADDDQLDLVALAFAKVIDAKSPWTYQHSTGVADIAQGVGRRLGFSRDELRELRRAALLHDLGKLGVSNLILDKPGKLTDDELGVIRRHPANTLEILKRVGCFRHLASDAAAHHERQDSRGYHLGIGAKDLSMTSRVLCVSDICDALRASRPYRNGLPVDRVLEIMGRDVGSALDSDCFGALEHVLIDAADDKSDVPAVQLVPALEEDYDQAA
jgi:HD-GYP domain-containing protein (c-di-GMP phosphodiesterase class II)